MFHIEQSNVASFNEYLFPLIWILVLEVVVLLGDVWFVFYFESSTGSEYEQSIVAKILLIFAAQLMWNYLLAIITDLGISDFAYGSLKGFNISIFMGLSLFCAALTLLALLPYTALLLDSDMSRKDKSNNKKKTYTYSQQPWFKALIWLLILLVFFTIVLMILYFMISNEALPQTICSDNKFYTNGIPCVPKCEVFWEIDPTVCIRFSQHVVQRKANALSYMLLIVHSTCGLIVSFLYPIGLVTLLEQEIHEVKQMRLPRLSHTTLQVRKSDYADVVKAMLLIGTYIRKRRLRMVPLSYCSLKSWRRKLKLNIHSNRFHRACHLFLGELDDLQRQAESVSFWYKLYRYICLTMVIIITIWSLLHGVLFRILPVYGIMPNLYGASSLNRIVLSLLNTDEVLYPILASMSVFLAILLCYVSVYGYVTLCSYLSIFQPVRLPKRKHTSIRNMTKLLIVASVGVFSVPYFIVLYLERVDRGTWINRNTFSMMVQRGSKLRNSAVGELLGFSVLTITLICICFRNFRVYPFGLGEKDALKKDALRNANAIVAKWKEESKERKQRYTGDHVVDEVQNATNIANLAAQFKK